MDLSPVSPTTRLLIGLAAVGLLIGGAGAVLWTAADALGGMLIRVGVLFGAVWLVAPLIKRPGLASIAGLGAGALVLVRPRLIWAVAAGLVIWWFARRSP
jgi:hypothetical protein